MGLAVLPAHDFQVFPLDGSREVFGNTPVDGVIGEPLFERYAVTIDYAARLLTFVSNERFQYAGNGVSVPFSRLDEIPTINAALDGITGEFDVDTGARSSLILFAPFIEHYNLRRKYSAVVEGITGWGVGGPVRSQLARAGSFAVGGIAVKGPIIRLTTQRTGLTATLDKAGLIGPDILRQFRVTFDYAHRRMILDKGPLFGTADSYDKTGMWLGQDGDYFKVLDVISGGPASAAGLKIGDLVTSIGDKPARDLSLPEVRQSFKDEPSGSSVTMTIRDSSGARVVRLVLRDLVWPSGVVGVAACLRANGVM